MIVDLENESAPASYEADLCVIGAGPAGMAIARRLAGASFSIVVLESGGLGLEAGTQDLARGETSALGYSLEGTRLRLFGGTTHHWEGWSLPLTPIDFRKRDWVPLSGWPFGFEELAPYYKSGYEFLSLGAYEPDAILPASPFNVLTPAGKPVFDVFHIQRPASPWDVCKAWELGAIDQPNLSVVLHANVMPLKADGRTLRDCTVSTLGGRKATVRAKVFVLATGGIENARLLLASDNLANSRGLVGKYFMEHVFSPVAAALLPVADYKPPFEAQIGEALYEGWEWRFSEAAAEELKVLSCGVGVANYKAPPHPAVPGNQEFVPILVHAEQAPRPESFVALGKEKDPFGVPRALLNWVVDDQTQETVRQCVLQFSAMATRAGYGRVFIPEPVSEVRWPHGLWPACHHMGTTRMTADPAQGVVDPDCKAHDMDNLYIAGSSVFPTVGHVNPTLNLTVLALRLGDHLKGVMKG